jgi:hypothetical protein
VCLYLIYVYFEPSDVRISVLNSLTPTLRCAVLVNIPTIIIGRRLADLHIRSTMRHSSNSRAFHSLKLIGKILILLLLLLYYHFRRKLLRSHKKSRGRIERSIIALELENTGWEVDMHIILSPLPLLLTYGD